MLHSIEPPTKHKHSILQFSNEDTEEDHVAINVPRSSADAAVAKASSVTGLIAATRAKNATLNRLSAAKATPSATKAVKPVIVTPADVIADHDKLPGTCPSSWRSLYMLHVPKAGGTSLRNYLMNNLARQSKRPWCGQPMELFPYNCYSMTAAQHQAFLANFTSQFSKTCFGYSSHYDTSLQHDLAPEVMSQAITVVTLRQPVERFISEFRHTKEILFNSRASIKKVLDHFHGFNPANHMTLQLAGELGCATSNLNKTSLRHQQEQLLQRAKANLDRFCVVMVHERLPESVAYLQHVTGWDQVRRHVLPELGSFWGQQGLGVVVGILLTTLHPKSSRHSTWPTVHQLASL